MVFLDPLPADAVVDIEDKGLILQHSLKDIQQALLPGLIGDLSLQGLPGILHASPFHQVIDILEVIIEGHAADAAVLGNIIDGHFIQGLLQEQIFQRCFQRPFRYLGHKRLPVLLVR